MKRESTPSSWAHDAPVRGIAAIPTNDDLTLVLVGCPYAQARDFRRDMEANHLAFVSVTAGTLSPTDFLHPDADHVSDGQ
jgi:hypothetical protein